MGNNEIIKFEQNLVKHIGNALFLTDKLLAINNKQIKIFIANDHTLFINGIKKAIENFTNIRCVGEAGSFKEVYYKLKDNLPDILLTDDQMPNTNILNDLINIKKIYPDLKIILHSIGATDALVEKYIKYIDGYISFTAEIEYYIQAFEKVHAGHNYFIKNEYLNGKLINNHITYNKEEFISIINFVSQRGLRTSFCAEPRDPAIEKNNKFLVAGSFCIGVSLSTGLCCEDPAETKI